MCSKGRNQIMVNKVLLKPNNEQKYLVQGISQDLFVLDLSSSKEDVVLEVKDNSNVDISLTNLASDKKLTINIGDNAFVNVSALDHNETKSFKITANVGYKSTFSAFLADFIPGKCKGEILVNLNKEYATCEWHLASLSINEDNKEFDVSVYHNAINTYAQMDSYGVCRDEGKLLFSGICQIVKGSHGSKAHQNAKIMVFDEKSNGIAKPILKIDENDIEASHAAVVGKINDEHIFYLTSRGLSEEEAKRIITLGYLKPILKGFKDEETIKNIEDLIEGKM